MKEIIMNFLNKHYYLYFDDINSNGAIYKLKNSHETKTTYTMTQDLYKTFNWPYVDTLLSEWKMIKLEKLNKKISDFLNNCEVILGQTNWIVKHKDFGFIDTKILSVYVDIPKNEESFLNYFFNEWYDNKIIDTSEKMMGGGL
jgi:hypothetical protein